MHETRHALLRCCHNTACVVTQILDITAHLVMDCINFWGDTKYLTRISTVGLRLDWGSCSYRGFLRLIHMWSPFLSVYCNPKYSFSKRPNDLHTCNMNKMHFKIYSSIHHEKLSRRFALMNNSHLKFKRLIFALQHHCEIFAYLILNGYIFAKRLVIASIPPCL